ncbi:MAG: AMP-binding protein, partial [Pseudomonadota bacterium]
MSAHLSVTGNEINWPATPSGVTDVTVHNTLPKLLLHNARIDPNAVAQREKDFGIWQAYSWAEMNRRVSRLALGMQELGLQGGDVVGIIGDNRPEWVWAEVATHACKAMSLGLYRDTLEEEIFYLLDYAKPRIIVAEDEEQVDKFLMLEDRIPSVQWIIYHDARGMGKYDDPRLVYIDDVEARGQQRLDAQANSYELLVEDTSGDDIAILCTTSGTTSNPKLAMWRHDALLGHAANYLRADPRQPGDEYLAVLPLPWVMEQMYSVAWNLVARMTVNFPEQEHTAMHDLREIGPHFVLLSPRVWEVVAADVRARTMDSSKWKRAIYDFGVRQGTKAIDRGKKAHVTDRVLFRALRDQLGFTRLQSAATGGAAMGPDTFKYFKAMGVPLKQLYGQTEA